MSVTAVRTTYPTVFEADLPTVSYEDAPTPTAAHQALKQARAQFPIAMGAHGPEILSYELAHTALRDQRMTPPPGLGLEAQGITSGPLWDRVITTLLSVNGEDHARLRRLLSKAFTPRAVARLDTTITDIITQLTDPLMADGRSEVVADIARPYPVPVICELSARRSRTGSCSRCGPMSSSRSSRGTWPSTNPKSSLPGGNSTTTSTAWSPSAAIWLPATSSRN
jgi:cytochrome P450